MNWINLEEEQPDVGEIVLCADEYNEFVSLGKFLIVEQEDFDEGVFELMHINKIECDSVITHWMPLPEPPKEIK